MKTREGLSNKSLLIFIILLGDGHYITRENMGNRVSEQRVFLHTRKNITIETQISD